MRRKGIERRTRKEKNTRARRAGRLRPRPAGPALQGWATKPTLPSQIGRQGIARREGSAARRGEERKTRTHGRRVCFFSRPHDPLSSLAPLARPRPPSHLVVLPVPTPAVTVHVWCCARDWLRPGRRAARGGARGRRGRRRCFGRNPLLLLFRRRRGRRFALLGAGGRLGGRRLGRRLALAAAGHVGHQGAQENLCVCVNVSRPSF